MSWNLSSHRVVRRQKQRGIELSRSRMIRAERILRPIRNKTPVRGRPALRFVLRTGEHAAAQAR
jgi:hypothetical protein